MIRYWFPPFLHIPSFLPFWCFSYAYVMCPCPFSSSHPSLSPAILVLTALDCKPSSVAGMIASRGMMAAWQGVVRIRFIASTAVFVQINASARLLRSSTVFFSQQASGQIEQYIYAGTSSTFVVLSWQCTTLITCRWRTISACCCLVSFLVILFRPYLFKRISY